MTIGSECPKKIGPAAKTQTYARAFETYLNINQRAVHRRNGQSSGGSFFSAIET
ncbi:hypothetical protein [Sulfitobacter sediminis]|uniref:hypothetical protein n=1 Tax=Sulfitobacter sediminis TaxID=3234186 RepID=UPI00346698B9